VKVERESITDASPNTRMGMMPRWRRVFHASACAFMCCLFGAIGATGLFVLRTPHGTAPASLRVAGVLFTALSVAVIFSLVRERQRIVQEFSYDGRFFGSGLLGQAENKLGVWRRSPACGNHRDARRVSAIASPSVNSEKAYLDYSEPNVHAVAQQLLPDRQ